MLQKSLSFTKLPQNPLSTIQFKLDWDVHKLELILIGSLGRIFVYLEVTPQTVLKEPNVVPGIKARSHAR